MPISDAAYVEIFEPLLVARVVALDRRGHADAANMLLLMSGELKLGQSEGGDYAPGPSLWIFPAGDGRRLTLVAGSSACLLSIASAHLEDLFAIDPEGLACRACFEKALEVRSISSALADELVQKCLELSRELKRASGCSRLVVSSYLQLIGAAICRETVGELITHTGASSLPLLQRFRQMGEQEFRYQRPVSFYAKQLHLTPDRLHATCTRQLGRSPLALIHDRLFQDARIRLERSNATIQTISAALNFKDPAHFSRFFKNKCNYSPAQFRSMVRAADLKQASTAGFEYHEWP